MASAQSAAPAPVGDEEEAQDDDRKPETGHGLETNAMGGILVQEQDVLKMWQFLDNTQDPMNELSRKSLKEASSEELPFKHINKVITKAFPELDAHEVSWALRCQKSNLHQLKLRPDAIWRDLQKNRCEEDIISAAFAAVSNEEGNLDINKVLYILETMGYHGITAKETRECRMGKKELVRRLLQAAGVADPGERTQLTRDHFQKLCSIGRRSDDVLDPR